MRLPFHKMNGAGNDFVVIDNRLLDINLSREQIALLCDRQRGVGADGLLAVEPAEAGADFKFRYYNADGGEAEMCGNGARCFGKFTAMLMGGDTDHVTFETIAGTLSADIIGDNVRIAMSDPFDLDLNADVEIDGMDAAVHTINTGVPHAVVFTDDLKTLMFSGMVPPSATMIILRPMAPMPTLQASSAINTSLSAPMNEVSRVKPLPAAPA